MTFENTKFNSVRGEENLVYTNEDFQIISNNATAYENIKNCKIVNPKWNANYCTNPSLGVLTFESLDADKMSRMASPIKIHNSA
jgi:hypothetical protein